MLSTIYKMADKNIGKLYAVHHGDYAGQLFALISTTNTSLNFLSMPGMENIEVPKQDFDEGFEKDIIQFVEKLPKHVFKVIKAQYEKNSNN